MMAVAALASCSQDEQVNISTGENEIVAGATTLSVDAATKAPVNSIPAAGLLARVPVSQTDGNYATEWQTNEGYMKFMAADQATSFCNSTGTKAPKFYPADGNIYLCGLYPEQGWGTLSTTATATINGNNDLMAAAQVTTTKDDAPDNFKTLTFKHLLTQLRIQFQAADQAAVDAWGNITSLKLLKSDGSTPIESQATVTLKDGTATFSGSGTVNFFQATSKTAFTDDVYAAKAPTTTATYVAYILCPSTTGDGSTGAEYQLEITSAGGAKEVVALDLMEDTDTHFTGPTAGNAFDILLNFKATEIKAMASITPWVDKGQTEVPVGE